MTPDEMFPGSLSNRRIGHNSLTAQADEERLPQLELEAKGLAEAVDKWSLLAIMTEDEAGRVRDLQAALTAREKEIEAAHDREKAPHLAAGRAVDERYRPVRAVLAACKEPLQRLLRAWTDLEKKRIADAAFRAEMEAKAAEEAAKAAWLVSQESKNVAASVAAEEANKVAVEAAKVAAKAATARVQVKSASGGAKAGSVRVYLSAKMKDDGYSAACRFFRGNAEVVTLFERLATAELRTRAADATRMRVVAIMEIPGFDTLRTEKIG